MTSGARLYLFLLLLAAGVVGGLELYPRSFRGFARRDLVRMRGRALADIAEIEQRTMQGRMRPDQDPADLASARRKEKDAELEIRIRNAQTATVLGLVPISLVFFVRTLPSAWRRRRATHSWGIVERVADEVKEIDESDLVSELQKLAGSKRAAIRLVASGPAMRCGYCGKRLRFPSLGRIGRRVFRKRPPPGAKDANIVLGDGWWWQRSAPGACRACGADDPRPF